MYKDTLILYLRYAAFICLAVAITILLFKGSTVSACFFLFAFFVLAIAANLLTD
jgi:hypothetical protein